MKMPFFCPQRFYQTINSRRKNSIVIGDDREIKRDVSESIPAGAGRKADLTTTGEKSRRSLWAKTMLSF